MNRLPADQREAFSKFMTGKRDVLAAAGFSPAQIHVLDRVAKDGLQANRSISLAHARGDLGSSALSTAAGHQSMFSRIAHDVASHALELTGFGVGFGLAGLHGSVLGALAGAAGRSAVNAFREAGLNRVREMRIEAALNPDFGLALLQSTPKNRNALSILANRAQQLSVLGAEKRQDDRAKAASGR